MGEGFATAKRNDGLFFHKHQKLEREFQQLVVRENNDSSKSNASEYFITDIEHADTKISARFDLLAIRWLADDRQKAKRCKAAFIEMKYGDDALGGSSGMIKHLKDFHDLIKIKEEYKKVLRMMESQFRQLDELSLLNYKKSSALTGIELTGDDKPEVIFILGNHNPRSTKLSTILEGEALDEYDQSPLFDLRFCVSSFAGYGLHTDNMLSLTQMRILLKKKLSGLVSL